MAVAPDQIRLAVPARRQSLSVLRNMAGNAARLCGFSYNRFEEARLAVRRDRGTPGPAIWPPEPWVDSLEHTVISSLASDLELISDGGPM